MTNKRDVYDAMEVNDIKTTIKIIKLMIAFYKNDSSIETEQKKISLQAEESKLEFMKQRHPEYFI